MMANWKANTSKSFNNTSIMDSSYSTGARLKSTGQMLSECCRYSLETFGLPLPSMVKIAIANCPDQSKITTRLDVNGWAWLVCGRSLFIWKHGGETSKKSGIITCRELQLPPSELLHSADLVCVVPSRNSSTPAAIAVNPEGLIHFWVNIANESSTVSINADIPGQECDSLTNLWPMGCILTTTSGTILFIKAIQGRGNKPTLVCQPISVQQNWLVGWKRVTNMFMNPITASASGLETRRAKVFFPFLKDARSESDSREVYILSGTAIQQWNISNSAHNCIYETALDDIIRRQFFENVWSVEEEESNTADLRAIQVWILDITCILHAQKIAVFAAAKSHLESFQNLVYGIVVFPKSFINNCTPDFYHVRYDVDPSINGEEALLTYQWKIWAAHNCFYIVSKDVILLVSDDESVDMDMFESRNIGGINLGSGMIADHSIVIFNATQGLLAIHDNTTSLFLNNESTLADIRVPDHLSMSICQTTSSTNEEVNKYKSAFQQFCSKQNDQCLHTLEELFPPKVPNRAPHDPVDLLTVELCENLVNDAPPSDPRWGSGLGSDDMIASRAKLLIKNILADKKAVVEFLFQFLNSVGIWPRLTGVVSKQEIVATASILYNLYEKVGFAMALQAIQSDPAYRSTMDATVKAVIVARSEKDERVRFTHVNANDVFYKDVNRIDELIPILIHQLEETLNDLDACDMPNKVVQTNEILLKAVADSTSLYLSDRISSVHSAVIQPLMESDSNHYQVLPWIVEEENLFALQKHHELVVRFGVQKCDPSDPKIALLLSQMQQIADLILDGLRTSLESIHSSEKYGQKYANFEKIRSSLLKVHLNIKDYEGAAALAEKYIDFDILVSLCYQLKDISRLESYFDKYGHLEFCEFTFDWFVKKEKTKELIETFSLSNYQSKLESYMQCNHSLAWHHYVLTEKFSQASHVLEKMAAEEETSVGNKKLLLCLSKLNRLAGGDAPTVEEELQHSDIQDGINSKIDLIKFQEELPDNCLTALGFDRATMRVLSISEIIDAYTMEDVDPDPANFLQALRVTDFISSDELKTEKRLLIVARAIKRDPWNEWETDHPLDTISESLLYNFLVAAMEQGYNLDELYQLPILLKEPMLAPMTGNANCKFLLQACYEELSSAIES